MSKIINICRCILWLSLVSSRQYNCSALMSQGWRPKNQAIQCNKHVSRLFDNPDNFQKDDSFALLKAPSIENDTTNERHRRQQFTQKLSSVTTTVTLAAVLALSNPAFATVGSKSTTAAQIHLNSLPPSSISVQIDDLPFIGGILSGTYSKIDDAALLSSLSSFSSKTSSSSPPVIIQSPPDKVSAIRDLASSGHLEFDVEGILQTHVNVDVAASEPGIATIRVETPLIPMLPFRNAASALVPPAASALKLAHTHKTDVTKYHSPTAAHITVNKLPPSAVSVEIQDLPVLGKALSGLYTKVDDLERDVIDIGTAATTTSSVPSSDTTSSAPPAAVTIESPKDKVSAIKAIASSGHLEFDVDGVLTTHLDVDIATDTPGCATIRVASSLIPILPFRNAASY